VILKNLTVAYDLGYASRNIFQSLFVKFTPGVNYVWGPNGSGKSTLLGCIRGDVTIQEGEILVDGNDVTNLAGHKRKTFLLTQNPHKSVSPDLRVYENLIAAGQHRRTILGFSSHQAILDELEAELAKVKLTHLSKDDSDIWLQQAGSLSGGQAQRVALYMALLSHADVLLADEPSSGLDNDNLKRLIAVFERVATVGKTLIIATHDNRLMRADGSHYEINNGRILPLLEPSPYSVADELYIT
jgi:ABC-type multidrug transport system ATPase subunit